MKAKYRITGLPSEVYVIRELPAREVIPQVGKEKLYATLKRLYEIPQRHGLGMSKGKVARTLKKRRETVFKWINQAEEAGYLKVRPPIVRKMGNLVRYSERETERFEMIDAEYVYTLYRYPDSNICYTIGYIYGDGYIAPYSVMVAGTDWEALPFVLKKAKGAAWRFDSKAAVYYADREGRSVPRKDAYLWKIYISSVAFVRALTSEEGLREDTLDLVFLSPFRGDTLAGLWDSDGNLSVRWRIAEMRMNEQHLPLLKRMRFALLDEGISVTPIGKIPTETQISIIAGKTVKSKLPMYRFYVRVSGMPRWIELIGKRMVHPRKVTRVAEIKKTLL